MQGWIHGKASGVHHTLRGFSHVSNVIRDTPVVRDTSVFDTPHVTAATAAPRSSARAVVSAASPARTAAAASPRSSQPATYRVAALSESSSSPGGQRRARIRPRAEASAWAASSSAFSKSSKRVGRFVHVEICLCHGGSFLWLCPARRGGAPGIGQRMTGTSFRSSRLSTLSRTAALFSDGSRETNPPTTVARTV